MEGAQRLIIATCEKGTVENIEEMRGIKAGLDQFGSAPELRRDRRQGGVPSHQCAERCRSAARQAPGSRPPRSASTLMKKRRKIRIGMPRVLNMYSYAPMFTGYFESLGVQPENIVYSDYTSSELYRDGANRGAIDPCFPSKIGIPHVHNLLQEKHRKKPLDIIFFPMIDVLHPPLVKLQRRERLSDRGGHAGSCEGGVHQGK